MSFPKNIEMISFFLQVAIILRDKTNQLDMRHPCSSPVRDNGRHNF